MRKSKDIYVTQNMLFGVRDQLKEYIDGKTDELKSEFHGVKSEVHGLKSEINGVRSEVHGLKSEIHEVKAGVHGLKSEIHEVKSEVHGLKSEIHRLAVLMEDQNARNIYVLDGLSGLSHRQDKLENEFSEFKNEMIDITRG